MQTAVHARSAPEFRQLLRLGEAAFEAVLPFRFKVEADFYRLYRSAFLRESLLVDDTFAHGDCSTRPKRLTD